MPRNSRSPFIYKELLIRIQQGVYKEGDKLPTEIQLSEEFHASRPVIRSALEQLRKENYVESIRGSGTFVRQTKDPTMIRFAPISDLHEAIQCMEYRAILEPEIAYQAAVNSNEKDHAVLRQVLDQVSEHKGESVKDNVHNDLNFHLTIASIAHNRFYYQAMQMLAEQILDSISQVAWHFGNKSEDLCLLKDFWHREIVRGILIRDAALARTAMEMHIRRAMSNLILQSHGKTTADYLKYDKFRVFGKCCYS